MDGPALEALAAVFFAKAGKADDVLTLEEFIAMLKMHSDNSLSTVSGGYEPPTYDGEGSQASEALPFLGKFYAKASQAVRVSTTNPPAFRLPKRTEDRTVQESMSTPSHTQQSLYWCLSRVSWVATVSIFQSIECLYQQGICRTIHKRWSRSHLIRYVGYAKWLSIQPAIIEIADIQVLYWVKQSFKVKDSKA